MQALLTVQAQLLDDRLCYSNMDDSNSGITYISLDRIAVRPTAKSCKPGSGIAPLDDRQSLFAWLWKHKSGSSGQSSVTTTSAQCSWSASAFSAPEVVPTSTVTFNAMHKAVDTTCVVAHLWQSCVCRVIDKLALQRANLGRPAGRCFMLQAGSHTHTFLAETPTERKVSRSSTSFLEPEC